MKRKVKIGKLTIEVCQRMMDYCYEPHFEKGIFVGLKQSPKYHAQLKGRPGIWGCGKSVDEAVGSLMLAHSNIFLIEANYIGKQAR